MKVQSFTTQLSVNLSWQKPCYDILYNKAGLISDLNCSLDLSQQVKG